MAGAGYEKINEVKALLKEYRTIDEIATHIGRGTRTAFRYIEYLKTSPCFETEILDIGDGLAVSKYIKQNGDYKQQNQRNQRPKQESVITFKKNIWGVGSSYDHPVRNM